MLDRLTQPPTRDAARVVRDLTDLVLSYPAAMADQTALIFLDARGRESSSCTYAGLDAASRCVAANLARHTQRGNAILLAVEDQAAFVPGFFGCLLAGLIPAPMAPLRQKQNAPGYLRMLEILRNDHVTTLIVAAADATWLRATLALDGCADVTVLCIEDLQDTAAPQPDLIRPAPRDIAYLQYTSGSTSAPKGVVLHHDNVLANLAFMDRVFQRPETVRVASWLPLHHDMGLVGHLFTTLHDHGVGVFMPPGAFLANPALWLDVVHRYRANLSAAPTFAFEYCARKVSPDPAWDLSCWKHVFVGSETVSLPILNAFLDRFGASGMARDALRPVYGLAEATLLAAGGSLGLGQVQPLADAQSIGPDKGRALLPFTVQDGITIDIRDPASAAALPLGEEGEIWISGPSVSPGYFNAPDSVTQGGTPAGLATGDLGYLRAGNLYITGRIKDIVIIRGQNHSAEDLEFAAPIGVDGLAGHHRTACVSDVGQEPEQLIVFQEVERHTAQATLDRMAAAMRANLVQGFGLVADRIVFLPAGLLPRTPNNKIARQDCRRRYLDGDLRVVHEVLAQPVAPATTCVEPDPVVVVAMACRFPGAPDLAAFWENLSNGVDAITEVPPDRWANDLFYDKNPAVPGKVNTKCAGFVDDIALFDADLFAISPYEAAEIDPQQRMLLEVSWRLIENAGWKKRDLAQSATGVFVGISTNDYLYSKIKLTPGMSSFNAYSGLGNANSIAANRLSYFYDLRGPSMAIDTACSSSLTAFHLGAQAILSGECDQAIVGGVNAILSPGPTITLSQFGMMAPDGRCKTFDAGADGYVRAEGCGLVMLKRRSAALAQGDNILAVLDGSVCGQDGASTGITHPNAAAQHQLIERALKRAGLQGGQVSYLEAHGTGTAAGDPVEVSQLAAHYGAGDAPCHIGSVKANIGHLEAAAGIASVIKVVLMLQHARIPPQIHVKSLNPKLPLAGTRLRIADQPSDWIAPDAGARRAAISSFGFGGALAHVILSQPPVETETAKTDFSGEFVHPLIMSAPTATALQAHQRKMSGWLGTFPKISYRDLCHTQANGRSDLRFRSVVLATSRKGAIDKIDSALQLDRAAKPSGTPPALCFLFTGQGEHYLHMGREMYQRFALFRDTFDHCARAIQPPDPTVTLADLAFRVEDTSAWDDAFMQPILFAIQYALGKFYQACGLHPGTVIGHSLGEYAAATLAGCMTPEDAMRILHRRAQLFQTVPRGGLMAAIFAPADAVARELDPTKAQLGAINSPRKVVISGDGYEVDRVLKLFQDRGTEAYFLKTTQAFHSHLLDPIRDRFRADLVGVRFSKPTIPWISTRTGALMTAAPDADYWADHMRQPVLFSQAAAQLTDMPAMDFIEVGPGASCLASTRDTLGRKEPLYLRSLNIKKGDRTESYFFLDTLGQLYMRGHDIDWHPVLNGRLRSDLVPGQTLMRQPYWMKGVTADDFSVFATPDGAGATAPPTERAQPSPTPETTERDWHHVLNWRAAGKLGDVPPTTSTRRFSWLVIGGSSAMVDALAARLKARGEDLHWIARDAVRRDRGQTKPAAHVADTADKADWAKALSKVLFLKSRAGHQDWKVLVLDDPSSEATPTTASLEAAQARSLGSLITMLQALRDQAVVCPVWVLSENAQTPLKGERANLAAAALWGFCKTLYLEHPEWRGGMIDLSASDAVTDKATQILRKVLTPAGESCIALRGDTQYIQQIETAPLPAATSVTFRDDGVHIITGGLGGLGLACAEWIRARGGRRLILLSRRALPDRAEWPDLSPEHADYNTVLKINALEADGAQIEPMALDVRDSAGIAALFAQLDQSGTPVRGIVHAAGVNWFGKVMTLDVPRFLDTLKTKVSASWELHRHSAERDLDCFVLFSSVSAVWGSVELSHYTAANQFMDMLSQHRAAQGLPSLCVDWGPWADIGMSANTADQAVLEKLGLNLMPPKRAIAAMEAAQQAGRPLSLIADMDWQRFGVFIDFCLQPSMFGAVAGRPDRPDATTSNQIAEMSASTPKAAREMIEKVIRMELRAVTLIESADTIDADQRFNFMGMDSLMALSFAAALEDHFGVQIPSTLTYNYPTIRAVTDYLQEIVGGGSAEPVSAPAIVPTAGAEANWLRPLGAPAPGQPQMFCLPYAGSGVSAFAGLADALQGHTQLVGIQTPGREDHSDTAPFDNMTALIAALMQVWSDPVDSYFLQGHSMGAAVAYEFTHALQRAGRPLPTALILSGAHPPAAPTKDVIHDLPGDAFVARVIDTYASGHDRAERERALLKDHTLLRTDLRMFETYSPSDGRLRVPLSVICARHDPLIDPDQMRDWGRLCDDAFSFVCLDGGHQLVTEHTDDLARAIGRTLRMYAPPA